MKSSKIFLMLCIVLSIGICLCGCWNYTDIEKFAIVSGFAIDKNEQGDKYVVTVEVVNFEMSGKEAKQTSNYVESEGRTIFDAIRNVINLTGKKLYWAHARILIINQDMAKEGITPILDFISRDPEMRESMYVLVSIEKTAKEVLKQEMLISQTSSANIEYMVTGQKKLGKAPQMQVYKIVALLGEKGVSFSLPVIGLEQNSGKRTSVLLGTAIFKSDKLVGYLDSEETKYFLFAINKINKGILALKEDASNKVDDITLEIFKSKTKTKSLYIDNKLKINLDIKTEVAIGEVGTTTDYINEKNRKKLKKDADKFLKTSVENVIKKVQKEFDSDIFGFGMFIREDHPSIWKIVERDWDKLFKELDVTVDVDISLKNSGLLSKTLKKGD